MSCNRRKIHRQSFPISTLNYSASKKLPANLLSFPTAAQDDEKLTAYLCMKRQII